MKVKKFLCSILTFTMIMSTNVFASTEVEETTFDEALLNLHISKIESISQKRGVLDQNSINIKKIYDMDENEFQLVETGEIGYYIFDPESGKYLECSDKSPSPYLGYTENLYYFGPTNYYVFDGSEYNHTIIESETYQENELYEIQENFDDRIKVSREIKDIAVIEALESGNAESTKNIYSRATTYQYIPSYSYIKNAVYPKNTSGTCGYTASTIVLNYWNKLKPSKNIIPSKFTSTTGDLLTTGTTLQDELISLGGSDSTWALNIRDVLIDYCNKYGIKATSSYAFGKTGAVSEVKNGRPVILFGSLPDVSSSGKINHAVTAYGIENNSVIDYFVVHYGWKNYEHVVLDGGLIGSNTKFQLD